MKRLRGFDSLENLLRTLLLHVGWGWSLRETAVQAKLAGIADVSDVTLLNRRCAKPKTGCGNCVCCCGKKTGSICSLPWTAGRCVWSTPPR